MTEIPCPVPGCEKIAKDKADLIRHAKECHKESRKLFFGDEIIKLR